MKKIIIEIKEAEIRLVLLNNGKEVDFFCFEGGNNFGESLLLQIEVMIDKNELKLDEVEAFVVKSEISDKFTSVKIAEIVAKTLNFAKTVD